MLTDHTISSSPATVKSTQARFGVTDIAILRMIKHQRGKPEVNGSLSACEFAATTAIADFPGNNGWRPRYWRYGLHCPSVAGRSCGNPDRHSLPAAPPPGGRSISVHHHASVSVPHPPWG